MWDDARQLNLVGAGIAAISVLILIAGAISWSVRQPVFAIHRVVIDGRLTRTNAAHLEAVVREELRGTFFTMNLDKARASLQRVPWVRRIALRRQWPDRLDVVVTEHDPLARWNESALVDTDGEMFAADFDGELPQFEGPEGTAAQVTQRFREFGTVLQPLGMVLSDVRLSPRGGWQIRTTSGLALDLGRSGPLDRLTRFASYHARTIDRLEKSGTRIAHVDLRYPNGFAVRVPGFKERTPRKQG